MSPDAGQAVTPLAPQKELTLNQDSPLHLPLGQVTQGRNTSEHQAAPTLHAGGQGAPGTQ